MEELKPKLTQEIKKETQYFISNENDSAQKVFLNNFLERGDASLESFVKEFTERFKMKPNLFSEEKIKEIKESDGYKENSVYKVENGLIKKIK